MSFFSFLSPRRRSPYTAAPGAVQAETWRPATEMWAAAVWTVTALAAGVLLLQDRVPLLPAAPIAVFSFLLSALRLHSGLRILRSRAALAGSAQQLITSSDFIRMLLKQGLTCSAAHEAVWFGRGFEWTPEHAQKLYELSKVDTEQLIPSRFVCRLLNGSPPKDPHSIGLAAIDGMESRKEDIWVSEKTLEGGTLIVGTTQAGKGVLLTSLITQAVIRGDAVIIIDPKMSSRLQKAVERAAALANRSAPLFFHPNRTDGLRLNPLTHFERPGELASRITAVMSETGPFTAFAWSAVNTVVNLMVRVGQTPSIAAIESVLTGGFEALLLQAVEIDCGKPRLEAFFDEASLKNLKSREAVLYVLEAARQSGDLSEETLRGLSVYEHDPVHFAKITASLMPVLAMLTSGALRHTLSASSNDPRAMTLSEIIAQRRILYVCLNSLPDPTVAGAIGSLLLADLAACAGERYNNETIERTRVHLFVDECSNVINRSLIEILNKGAESGLRTTCAMQTVADLAARLGSTDEARMALGNFNSLVSLRTKDRLTQEFVAETFGRTYIANTAATLTNASDTARPGHFTAAAARQITSTREEIIPCDVLGKLPNCEFFASLAGGRLIKGRTPILIADESTSGLSAKTSYRVPSKFSIPKTEANL